MEILLSSLTSVFSLCQKILTYLRYEKNKIYREYDIRTFFIFYVGFIIINIKKKHINVKKYYDIIIKKILYIYKKYISCWL